MTTRLQLPEQGVPWDDLEPRLRAAGEHDVKWREGRSPLGVIQRPAAPLRSERQAV